MNNKDFLERVSQKTSFDVNDVNEFTSMLIESLVQKVADGDSVTIQGFGVFEPREKARRKIYNPKTKTFMVVPKKTTMNFKMSGTLKDRLNMD